MEIYHTERSKHAKMALHIGKFEAGSHPANLIFQKGITILLFGYKA